MNGADVPDDLTLVIGASGFLGSTIVTSINPTRRVLPTYHSVQIAPDALKLDLFSDGLQTLLDGYPVATVVMSAAIESEATDIVEPAMERLVTWCSDKRMVYLSSDGIFDGDRGRYTEADTVMPRAHYGTNLRLCENLVRRFCPNHCIVRPSYIYGYSGGQLDGRLEQTRAALLAGETVARYHDMYKSPLGVEQVAKAVVWLADSDFVGTIHVAGARLSTYEFHREAMEALGVPTKRLEAVPMPDDDTTPKDTSLVTKLWERLTRTRPLTVNATLTA